METRHRSSLATLLCEILQLEYQSEEFEDSFELCVRYCVNAIAYADFNKSLAKVVSFKTLDISASKFRLALRESGYVMSCVKFFMLHLVKSPKNFEEEETIALAKKFNVYKEDAETLYWILSRRGVKSSIANAPKVKTIKPDSVTPAAYDKMCDMFITMVDSINSHAKRIVRKLSFVVKSENFDRDEFITDLVACALKVHYYYSPNEVSYEYHLNRLRQAMSNYRINMIKHYTAEGRQRLVNVGTNEKGDNVFVQRTSSESQMRLNTGDDEDTRTYDELGSITQHTEKISVGEFNMSIDQLLTQILSGKGSKRVVRQRKARLLKIVVGRQVNGFDSWLRQKQLIKADLKTGIDFMDEKTRDEFMPILSQYLNVPVESIMKFLKQTAGKLAIDMR